MWWVLEINDNWSLIDWSLIITGHVSGYMLDMLRWLHLQQQILFHIATLVWRCLLGLAPAYLRDLCCPTPGTRGRCSLRSVERELLFVPFAHTSTSQVHAFSVAPLCGMGFLPLAQQLLPWVFSDTFYSESKSLL